MRYETREQWLEAACGLLTERVFTRELPRVAVSVGFPKCSRGKGSHAIGQCWPRGASSGDRHEIFISPELADPVRVLDVLTHELVHAIVGLEHGHKKAFKRLATAVGLEGKMTATVAGQELTEKLTTIADALGPFPHYALSGERGSGPKKQTTRMLKLECDECGYVVRTTQKWLDAGTPVCYCGGSFVSGTGDDEEGGDDE